MAVARFGTPNSLSFGGFFFGDYWLGGQKWREAPSPHKSHKEQGEQPHQGVQEAMTEPRPEPPPPAIAAAARAAALVRGSEYRTVST